MLEIAKGFGKRPTVEELKPKLHKNILKRTREFSKNPSVTSFFRIYRDFCLGKMNH